jgi:hypothetical protein
MSSHKYNEDNVRGNEIEGNVHFYRGVVTKAASNLIGINQYFMPQGHTVVTTTKITTVTRIPSREGIAATAPNLHLPPPMKKAILMLEIL